MKNYILLILILIPFFNFSQETLIAKSNGRVFNANNQKLSSEKVRELLSNDSKALRKYNAGKTKQTVGNVLLWGSLTTFIGKYISDTKRNKVEVSSNNQVEFITTDNTLYYVAGAVFVISIPIKIGFQKKIKKSISMINETNTKVTIQKYNSEIIANSNGVGISITF